MAAGVTNARGETARHARLKRLAFLWAQAHGYSACAMEVSFAAMLGIAPTWLPIDRSRKRLDRRRSLNASKRFAICDETIAIAIARAKRLEAICQRRQVLETRSACALSRICGTAIRYFLNSTSHDFTAIGHRGYARVLRRVERAAKSSLRLHQVRQIDRATAAQTCFFWSCLRSYSAIRRSRSDGARLWNPMVRSRSCENRSGRNNSPKIEFAFATNRYRWAREHSIDNWKSRSTR